MQRALPEVLASQRQMLLRRGKPADPAADAEMAQLFTKHLQRVEAWLGRQPSLQTCFISYNDLLRDPAPSIDRVNTFLGGRLNTQQITSVIDPNLYRQRMDT
ncbi:MAG: sulfotransferase domain-containing protein [Chloroflexaceae bacterium]|nr:sulfotransferase domain-containing protein [Chloroflexaceae bacterium]